MPLGSREEIVASSMAVCVNECAKRMTLLSPTRCYGILTDDTGDWCSVQVGNDFVWQTNEKMITYHPITKRKMSFLFIHKLRVDITRIW